VHTANAGASTRSPAAQGVAAAATLVPRASPHLSCSGRPGTAERCRCPLLRHGGITDAVLYGPDGTNHDMAVSYGGLGVRLALAEPLFVTDVLPGAALSLEVFINTSMWTDPLDFPCGPSRWGLRGFVGAAAAGIGQAPAAGHAGARTLPTHLPSPPSPPPPHLAASAPTTTSARATT
jgi:hypothetical protein